MAQHIEKQITDVAFIYNKDAKRRYQTWWHNSWGFGAT